MKFTRIKTCLLMCGVLAVNTAIADHNRSEEPYQHSKNRPAGKIVEYTIHRLTGINTPRSEFAPCVLNGQLIFVADRSEFDFENYNVNDNQGTTNMNLYVIDLITESAKAKPFSRKLISDIQNGPVSFAADGQTFYFTRVGPTSKNDVTQSQIFSGLYQNGKVSRVQPLSINNESHSIAHPAISTDNRILYFTSNMPGGYGGKDIWYCERSGDLWGEPKNLGPDINTKGDEMYPSLRSDGTLFYASNGLAGFGGLDIYSATTIDGKWILNRNEGLDLNSEGDDFGITFLNDSVGFFSSNRAGGAGEEDIFRFEYHNRTVGISGTVLLTENLKDYAQNRKVLLLDENGNVIDSTVTNAKGFFQFKYLDAEKKYLASVVETDPVFMAKARYYLAINDSLIYRVTGKMFGNRFVFKHLPIDPTTLPDLYTDDNLVFAGTLRYGEEGLPLKNTRLRIVSEFGDVVMETTSNEFGSFAFRNIPSDQNYLVTILEDELILPEGTKVSLLNKSGKEVRTFFKNRDGFQFRILQSDQALLSEMNVEDVDLVMGIYGVLYDQNKRPAVSARLKIKEENGENEKEWLTGVGGKFNFKELNAAKNYIFEASAADSALKGVTVLYLADMRGKIYKVLYPAGGKFTFKLMEADKFILGEFVADDPWLKVSSLEAKQGAAGDSSKNESTTTAVPTATALTIVENIYYAFGDHKLGADGEAVLNKAVVALQKNPHLIMEISAHTDAQAGADFNLILSRKRAQTAVEYLVKKGIHRKRLIATGYGETRLLNHCKDGVDCSEEQHRENRRTEFIISKQENE